MKYGNEAWNIYVEIRDVVIPCIIDTIKEYGDQAWAQIKAQLDTLCEMAQNGIAAIKKVISELQNKLEELKNKVQGEANALIEQIEGLLNDLKELLAKAEGLSEEVLEQIYAAIENVEKALEALK